LSVHIQTGKGVDGIEEFDRGRVGIHLRQPPWATDNTDRSCTVMFAVEKLDAIIEVLQAMRADAVKLNLPTDSRRGAIQKDPGSIVRSAFADDPHERQS
jgi:hypothetical protein